MAVAPNACCALPSSDVRSYSFPASQRLTARHKNRTSCISQHCHCSRRSVARQSLNCQAAAAVPAPPRAAEVRPEQEVSGMTKFLDSLSWNRDNLVAAIVQHVDTGEVLMQAFADRAAVSETLQTRLATFYSRSRKGRWCKGETSGHYIKILQVFPDCDRDSIIFLGEPVGPACHTGTRTCWYSEVAVEDDKVLEAGKNLSSEHSPRSTLLALEHTIQQRKAAATASEPGTKPSWTARLLNNPELLCSKVREEAGELCQTWEQSEGRERAASEAADLLYHAMVLLNLQGVQLEEVLHLLRSRFGTSGIAEKAARKPKP